MGWSIFFFLENQKYILKKQKLLRCEIGFTMVTQRALLTVSLLWHFQSNTNTHTHEISGNGLYSQKLPFTKEQN